MDTYLKRRDFLKSIGTSAAAITISGCMGQKTLSPECTNQLKVPSYLRGYEELYRKDPRQSALKWFEEAKFGLFMHYGLYSLHGRGEWVMFHEKIPVAQYEKLKNDFKADRFDADFITDMALDAGMKYINITSRHHDGFCLFETKTSDYNSVNSPAKRDLIAELAEQCQKKNLGLFLYYSYGADWRHPYYYSREFNRVAQPAYPKPDPTYKWQKDEDFQKYIDDAHEQIRELLTNYGPIAGIWFDPIVGYYGRPDLFPINKTYAMIRQLQPQTLISFKQGATGTEDFAAPERSGHSLAESIRKKFGETTMKIATHAWEQNKNKHNEICDTLQHKAWGYKKDAEHRNANEVMKMLASALKNSCNLLLNTGPLADGSIHPADVETLRKVGSRIRKNGWPG